MAKMMRTDEVIALIKRGASVKEIVVSDLEEKRLNFRDAILLADHGFVVPSGNINYSDSEIEYDADFDEVEWQENYQNLNDYLVSEGVAKSNKEDANESITIELSVKDKDVHDWLQKNTSKLQKLVHKLVIDLYHTDQMLHSK